VNHVGTVIGMIERYNYSLDEGCSNILDILEQIFLIVYYGYENLVYLARTRVVSFTEQSMDSFGNMSWFLEDFTGFLAALTRVITVSRKLQAKRLLLLAQERNEQLSRCVDVQDNNGTSIVGTATSRLIQTVQLEVIELQNKLFYALLSMVIVSLLNVYAFCIQRFSLCIYVNGLF
jgi:hypothetical protein